MTTTADDTTPPTEAQIDAAARVLETRWAGINYCCYFSELNEERQTFWRPVLRGWVRAVLVASERAK